MTVAKKAKEFAIKAHSDINQKYHNGPYSVHLEDVVRTFHLFKHLIPEEDWDEVEAGCWVHDVLEDTPLSWNDIRKAVNENVADYSYALQNEKGKIRKEKANAKYYDEMRVFKHAAFVKLCDRISNVSFSKINGSTMYNTYQKEHLFMVQHLYDGRYEEMWTALSHLIYS